ncbi:ankyrin repeat-containing domain protein [Zopfochytrium polystomum]|nr:ankyrin repeat-containing domain protein [Zopfochytrium polystomum]
MRDLAEFFVGCGADANANGSDVVAADEEEEEEEEEGEEGGEEAAELADITRGLESAVPLILACSGGHLSVVELLVERGGASVETRDESGRSALHCAASTGRVDVIEYLVMKGADVHATTTAGTSITPLFAACRGGHVDAARALVKHGAKKRVRVSQRVCPLHVACYMGHVGVVEVLLDERWETSGFDELLDVAVSSGHVEVVELLLHRKACRSATDRKRKKWFRGAGTEAEALVNAARQGHVEMARVLLDYGAAVDSADDLRRTALHHACEWGHVGVVELLLEEGASLEAVSIENMTAMDYAIAEGHADVVEVLRNWQ